MKNKQTTGATPLLFLIPLIVFLATAVGVLVFTSHISKESSVPSAVVNGPNMRIVANKETYARGEVATFSVFIDTKGEKIVGIDIEALFNPDEITMTDADIETKGAFPIYIGGNTDKTFVDEPNGRIAVSGLVTVIAEQATPIGPEGPVLVMTGTVQKSGKIEVVFVPNASDESNLTRAELGGDILAWVEGATFTVE